MHHRKEPLLFRYRQLGHVGCGPSVFRFLIVQKKLLKIISPQTVLDDLEEGRNTKEEK